MRTVSEDHDVTLSAVSDHPARQVCLATSDSSYGVYRGGFKPRGLEVLQAAVGKGQVVTLHCRSAIRDVYGGSNGLVRSVSIAGDVVYEIPEGCEPSLTETERESEAV